MDIDEVLDYIITAKKGNFKETEHFKIKSERRKNKLPNQDELIYMLKIYNLLVFQNRTVRNLKYIMS